MAAQVEVQTGEVARARLHLNPLTNAGNTNLIEIPSVNQAHIISPEANKPAPTPKPRLTPKPFTVEKNPTIKPILAPKPLTKPRPESTRLAGYKPDPPSTPKPTARPISTNPNRPASTSFKTSSKLSIGQTAKPVAQPFKPAPPLPGDPCKAALPAEKQKPSVSNLAYSKSLKGRTAAEWSGSARKEDEREKKAPNKSGASITRAKSLGFLVEVGQEENEVKDKSPSEVSVPLRLQPRSSRPRPVSAIFPVSPTNTDAAVPAPRWGGRRPLSADLTSKFESIGLSVNPKNTPDDTVLPQWKEQEKAHKDVSSQRPEVDQSDQKPAEAASKELEDEKQISNIVQAVSEIGVKRLIKQLTEDVTPMKPVLKPRPLPLDLTKRFSSERSPDLVSLFEAGDRHDIDKTPQTGVEEFAVSPNEQLMYMDVKDSPDRSKKLSTPEWPVGPDGEAHTVRASLFENVVERRSVFLLDDGRSLSGQPFETGGGDNKGSPVSGVFKEPASPSSPLRASHAFDTVHAVEGNKATSESVPSAQREDKAATLRSRRSEASRRAPEKTDPVPAQEPQHRYLRIGALQKWSASGFDKVTDSENVQKIPEMDEPKWLKALETEEQAKPRATYFALTGQMQEPVSPGAAGLNFLDKTTTFDNFSVSSASGSSQGKIVPVKRNPSLDEAFEKNSLSMEEIDELMRRSLRSAADEPTKEDRAKIPECEREKLLEMERQALSEFTRRKERDLQREAERTRRLKFEKEKREEKQRALEKQKLLEFEKKQREIDREEKRRALERQKLQELETERERQQRAEKEKQRQRDEERQRELDKENLQLEIQREKQKQEEVERMKELERAKLLEYQKQKQREKEKQQLIELEKQKLREKAEREEAEKLRQMALEQEMLRIKELEREKAKQREMARQVEKEKQMELEFQRIRESEREKQKQLDMEKQELENQRVRQRELKEKQRKDELETLKEIERRQLLEFERQRQAEKEKAAELEKRRAKEKMEMEKAESEKMRLVAKQQEAERQRLKEKQRKEEQERFGFDSSALKPKVFDLDSVLRNDSSPKSVSPRSDSSTRWKEPYKPAILDIDSFTLQAQLSPHKDFFPASSFHGAENDFGGKFQQTTEKDSNWKVPPQSSASFSSPVWTTSVQDPWELRPVEMPVDKPVAENRKPANKLNSEQPSIKQEEKTPNSQRHWSAFLDEPLFLEPVLLPEAKTATSHHGVISNTTEEQIWIPREPQPPKDNRAQRKSQGSQELNRLRSRSVSRRSAPSGSAVEGNLSRMRSRSANREQVQQKQSGDDDGKGSGTPYFETDSQYGTWETGLRSDGSLTPATPSSESNLTPSPRKPTPPHTLNDQNSHLEIDTLDSFPPSLPAEIQTLAFPDAPTTLLDTSALRSRAQLGKKRNPRTRPSRAARQKAEEDEGNADDWIYRDSTEVKTENKDDGEETEEHNKAADTSHAAASQPQRVALFPGLDPSALKVQLKKRADSDNQIDSSIPSPSQLSRSPKSPFLPGAARVLPPSGGKDNNEEDSPQWLKELKSKKRLSQYESES